MTRLRLFYAAFLGVSAACGVVVADDAQAGKLQDRKTKEQVEQQRKEEQEPPEEDEGLKEKTYEFNPLQATKEMKTGEFYYKKGNYKAAARRFREATRWDPTSAEAMLRLAQADEKLKDTKGAHDAYAKYLELAPDGKEAEAIRKKLGAGH